MPFLTRCSYVLLLQRTFAPSFFCHPVEGLHCGRELPTVALAQTNAARRPTSPTTTGAAKRKTRGRGLVLRRKVVGTPTAGRPPACARVGEVAFHFDGGESAPCFAGAGSLRRWCARSRCLEGGLTLLYSTTALAQTNAAHRPASPTTIPRREGASCSAFCDTPGAPVRMPLGTKGQMSGSWGHLSYPQRDNSPLNVAVKCATILH